MRSCNNPSTGAYFSVRSSGNGCRLFISQSISSFGKNNCYLGFTGSLGEENVGSKYVHSITNTAVSLGADTTIDGDLTVTGTISGHPICYYKGIIEGSTGNILNQNGLYTFTCTRLTTGRFYISFSTTLPNANYYFFGSVLAGTSFRIVNINNKTTTGCDIYVLSATDTYSDASFSFMITS